MIMSGPANGQNGWQQRYSNILQTLIVVGLALSGIWAGLIAPMDKRIADLNDKIAHSQDKDLDRFLAVREHLEFKTRVDEHITAVKEEAKKNSLDIAYLRDNQVTRAEHVTHWEQIKGDISNVRSDVDVLRRDVGGQYTIGEKIKDLQAQIEQLRGIQLRLIIPCP